MLDRIKKLPLFILCFICVCVIACNSVAAQGNLLIFPKRINLDASNRTAQLSLSNTGTDTARYLLSFIQLRMTENGSFETITQPDSNQNFADKNIRFFPRTVLLAPNEAQAVKIQLINTNLLKSGEYRSHLYFRAQKESLPMGEEKAKNDSTLSIRIEAIFGISIPVIIRTGELSMDIKVSNAKFYLRKDTVKMVKFDLTRTGNISFYGDISIDHISTKGKITKVGMAYGMALYTPNSLRHFEIQLDPNGNIDIHSGSILITCTELIAKGIKPAQQKFFLN